VSRRRGASSRSAGVETAACRRPLSPEATSGAAAVLDDRRCFDRTVELRAGPVVRGAPAMETRGGRVRRGVIWRLKKV